MSFSSVMDEPYLKEYIILVEILSICWVIEWSSSEKYRRNKYSCCVHFKKNVEVFILVLKKPEVFINILRWQRIYKLFQLMNGQMSCERDKTERKQKRKIPFGKLGELLIPMFSDPICMIVEHRQYQTEPKYFYINKHKCLLERVS